MLLVARLKQDGMKARGMAHVNEALFSFLGSRCLMWLSWHEITQLHACSWRQSPYHYSALDRVKRMANFS